MASKKGKKQGAKGAIIIDDPLPSKPVEHVDPVMLSVKKLKPNPYNPNYMSDHDFELLMRSIEEDGFTQAILVQSPDAAYMPNVIVDGEHRWRAVTALKWAEIPVVYSHYDEAAMKIATLRHNRARGSEELTRTADVLRELQASGNIEGAADSLMMDSVEMSTMLENIPPADIVLRKPGDRLTVENIKDNLLIEKKTAKEKFLDDEAERAEEYKNIAVTLKVTPGQRTTILKVLKDFAEKKDIAGGIHNLCLLYQDDAAATTHIENQKLMEGENASH